MSEAVDKMIGEACRVYAETGMRKVSSGSITAALLTLDIPLETLAALKDGSWVAVPREPMGHMVEAARCAGSSPCSTEDAFYKVAAALRAAPTKPEA